MSDKVEIIPVGPGGFGDESQAGDRAGAIVSVVIPNKWVLVVGTEHPAYADMFRAELAAWDAKALADFLKIGETLPHITRELVRVELEHRRPAILRPIK